MKCPSCGAEMLEGRSYCSMCGASVPENTTTKESATVETSYSQTSYQQPYQTYGDGTPIIPAEYQPLSPWAYIGYMFLFSIPCVGFIVMCIFAFGSQKNINLKNFARSYFYMWIISIVISVICFAVFMGIAVAVGGDMTDFLNEFSHELSTM